jgi:hypothetical protein
MQAIAASARAVAAARVGWRRWPAGAQMFALVVACTIAAAIVIAVPLASDWIGDSAAARAAVLLWRTFFEPIVPAAIAVVAVMCTATALLVAGLKHVALEGPWTPHA